MWGRRQVWVADRRYIVCVNENQAKKATVDREAIVAALREQLEQGPPLSGQLALVGNREYRKYLVSDGAYFQIDEAKLEAEARYDGTRVLCTNTTLSGEEVALKYKQLWQVEALFRTTKRAVHTLEPRCEECPGLDVRGRKPRLGADCNAVFVCSNAKPLLAVYIGLSSTGVAGLYRQSAAQPARPGSAPDHALFDVEDVGEAVLHQGALGIGRPIPSAADDRDGGILVSLYGPQQVIEKGLAVHVDLQRPRRDTCLAPFLRGTDVHQGHFAGLRFFECLRCGQGRSRIGLAADQQRGG